MVKINPSLMFTGACGDAFRRYASLFGGEIVMMLTYAESPLQQQEPREWDDEVWFARPDGFVSAQYTIRFARRGGRVTGFEISHPRARGVEFVREP